MEIRAARHACSRDKIYQPVSYRNPHVQGALLMDRLDLGSRITANLVKFNDQTVVKALCILTSLIRVELSGETERRDQGGPNTV